MFKITPKKIVWYGSSTGPTGLTVHLTTNPKPKDVVSEVIGTAAQLDKKLAQFDYFDLSVVKEADLEHFIELASIALESVRYAQKNNS